MARPFTASDEEILTAARNVFSKRGPDAFSIAEVASEVGLSRAAIILRFKSTHALKVASLAKMVEQFAAVLEALPKTPSGDNVLRFAAFIGAYVGSRESSARFFANYYTTSMLDRELFDLERQRGAAMDRVISNVMPKNVLEHDSAVVAFRAHISGTIMSWHALDDSNPCRYVVTRTREWLKLARISFSEQLVEELCVPQAGSKAQAAAKTKRTAKRPARRSKPVAAAR
jgi:TetR/AcrR family macrolide resistance operon transcriptional repressor